LLELIQRVTALADQLTGSSFGERAQPLAGALEQTRLDGQMALAAAEQRITEAMSSELDSLRQLASKLVGRPEIDELARRVEHADKTAHGCASRVEQAHQVTARELDEIRIRLLRAERRLHPPKGYGERPAFQLVPFDYFLFEQRFRGSVADIKQRQANYLELFVGRRNVLDLGCGRGEFVELLQEQGVNVIGVDSNSDMADFCRDKGLSVIQADLLAYLAGVADGSLDGIFIAQVIEHFAPLLIWEFLQICSQKLAKGGVIVLETINPGCAQAMHWFYLDPTHVRPVQPDLLRFMLEQAAFAEISMIYSAPLGSSHAEPVMRCASTTSEVAALYQDYAAVGFRT
jgi:O-antigen chain-terminating methyltransferase